MPLHKSLLKNGFKLPQCEKHFHDHDETWLVLAGTGAGFWIDHAGTREEFALEPGDVWMIPAGYEHGSVGQNSPDFTISVFDGTMPPGCHKSGHYYIENEGYIPSFQLVKTPTGRYRKPAALPATMKGVMFVEKGRAVLQDEPSPVCRPGQILCQTVYSGVTNGTERNVLLGGNYGGTWPSRCGYQTVGRVLDLGIGVKNFAIGDLVYSGNFSQHVAYFAADAATEHAANLVIKLPAAVEPKHAALFGVASVAMHDVRRADSGLGDHVLVVGAGLIGQFTAQAARAAGAHVTMCDLDSRRLALAKTLGAHETVTITGDDSWAALKAAGMFDAIFEDSGAPILDKLIGATWGLGLVKTRGLVVMIAGRKDVTYNFNAGQGAELTIFHASHFDRSDILEVCRLVADGVIKVGPLIQDVVPIENAASVYDRLRDQPNTLLGTVFEWG